MRILICESDPGMREVVSVLLEAHGFSVTAVSDPRELPPIDGCYVLVTNSRRVAQPYSAIAATSITPSTAQQMALRFCPAPRNPAAALKHRIALVHPLAHAAGLLSIFKIRMCNGIGSR